MRLEMADFPVKDVRFSSRTSYDNGLLEIDKDELLKTYWNIPQRQIDTSVVLGINITKA